MSKQQMPARIWVTELSTWGSRADLDDTPYVRADLAKYMADALEELRADFVRAWGFEPGQENKLYRPTLDRVDAALSAFLETGH